MNAKIILWAGIACLLLLLVTASASIAQNTIAKLKYEEAEEAFVANDYATTLSKLNEAEKLLGEVNPKTLYLRINAQYRKHKSAVFVNLEDVSQLKKNCSTYLSKYETVEGIEDKYKDIYKISEAVKTFATPDEAFANVTKGNVADLEAIAMAYEDCYNFPRSAEWYKKAAEKNSALAFARLGAFSLWGVGMPMDSVKAKEYLEKAVAGKHPSGYYFLGDCYKNGGGPIAKDSLKALEYMRLSYEAALPAAQKGDRHMMYYAGLALISGRPEDYAKGLEWLEKGGQKGDRDALERLGDEYDKGARVTKDAERAMQYYMQSAENGSCNANYCIAMQYYTGYNGAAPDFTKAKEWLETASEHGSFPASYMLAIMYMQGAGVQNDVARALEWLELSGKRGYAYAYFNIGDVYFNGTYVKKDFANAAHYLLLSAEQAEVNSMNLLGHIYFQGGNGITQDFNKAASWYQKAAEKGDSAGICDYGLFLSGGYTGAVSAAIPWLVRAAEKNSTPAVQKLYEIYASGKGDVKKDKKQAQFWATQLTKGGKSGKDAATTLLRGIM